MTALSWRRTRNVIATLALAGAVVLIDWTYRLSMRTSSFLSGWTLAAVVLFLAGYNLRKRLPMLRLGNSATWLQLHVYAGLLTGVLFAVHVGYRIPNGQLEAVLAILYLGVFLSGIWGLFLSRTLAARLTSHGDEVLYERIPFYVRRIRDEVHDLVLNCISETETSMIPEFYRRRLQLFFARPRFAVHHLFHSLRPLRAMLLEIQSQDRYLNDRERSVMREIEERFRLKDSLDYQYTLQSTLKYWLFLHVPLTYALLIFAAAHVMLVYAYFGGV
jgi:hypothetical protein